MSGFLRRFVLSMIASKLERMAHRRGHNPVVDGLLREVHYRMGHRPPYHHPRAYGYHGHYRHHGHYRRRRRRW